MTKHTFYMTVKKTYRFEIFSESNTIDEIDYMQILSTDPSLAEEIDEDISFNYDSEEVTNP